MAKKVLTVHQQVKRYLKGVLNDVSEDVVAAFKEGVDWQTKQIANKMYNVGYSYDSIAEALGIECADVVDMLDFDE